MGVRGAGWGGARGGEEGPGTGRRKSMKRIKGEKRSLGKMKRGRENKKRDMLPPGTAWGGGRGGYAGEEWRRRRRREEEKST